MIYDGSNTLTRLLWLHLQIARLRDDGSSEAPLVFADRKRKFSGGSRAKLTRNTLRVAQVQTDVLTDMGL